MNEKLIEEARATMRRQEWAPAGLLIRLADALEAAEKAHTTTPPDGWFYMGSHVGAPWLNLEFSEEMDETGLPLWERPVQHTPTDDEREALARAWDAGHRKGIRWKRGDAPENPYRSEVPEPSAEGYAEFEGWEQEMFRHQPVLSMADGSIAGCQCLDRVFVKGREDWGTHLASIVTSRLSHEPQGEPTDAQLIEARADFRNDPDSDGLTLGEAFNTGWFAALRAAGEVRS